ncbi:MAG: TonB-dependent receptor [Prevotella sp.]|nr:TonB-dependent receptor [Prevotella sp.]
MKRILTLLLFFYLSHLTATAHNISIHLTEKATGEPIIMATCVVQPLGSYAVTDMEGNAKIKDIPQGRYELQVSYVGFEPIKMVLNINKDLSLKLKMVESSLALQEVTVVARQNAAGTSTSSIVGRQAIDHLQATSLADVMQLVPGAIMGNADMTSTQQLQLRELSANNITNRFGAGIVMDGVPMSNNGQVAQGDFSSTTAFGTDMRQIAADDIEEVEVIRGIPSAEYGDLTSGLVVVHSKIGVTPWQVKGKVNPGQTNYSLGKGLRLGTTADGRQARGGVLNFNVDYAQAWGDPRQKTRSFNRYNFSVGYGADLTRRWHTDTKVRYSLGRDWSGNDPDAISDGTESKSTQQTFSLTHNGKLTLDRKLARNVSYTVGLTLTANKSRNTSFVGTGTGLIPIITATETGYWSIPWKNSSYLATGINDSRPGNVYLKVSDAFYLKKGKTNQRFKVGADYKYDWNAGKGYYNEDEQLPLRPNSDGRPRAFSDIPGLHQLAFYAEDNFSWQYAKNRNLRVQLGARFTAMQPFDDVRTFALSPRLNVSLELTEWLSLRGGIGLNAKTPGLSYLYPDKHYTDRVALNYMPQNGNGMLVYHTNVYEVAYSKDLKNATTTKIEAGIDIRLPGDHKMSVLVYQDRTPDGFGNVTEYRTYTTGYFATPAGMTVDNSGRVDIGSAIPTATYMNWTTTGRVGNTNVSVNRGVEFDFDCGRIEAINTAVYLSGAWQESKSHSKNLVSTTPAKLPTAYALQVPFKMVYPSELDYSRYRRFVNTLRLVTNIPALRMVASFTGQVIWHNATLSYLASKNPVGWITSDLAWHDLSSDMLGGYLGMDGNYYATVPEGIDYVAITDQVIKSNDNNTVKNPVTWNLSFRLTKEFGKTAGLSFYVNNALFYEPFMSSSTTSTLTQRNTGTYSFGVELFFKL